MRDFKSRMATLALISAFVSPLSSTHAFAALADGLPMLAGDWSESLAGKAKEQTSLVDAFKRIEKLTGYRIMYSYEDVKKYKAQSNPTSKDVRKALSQAIGSLPLEYKVNGKFVTISMKAPETSNIYFSTEMKEGNTVVLQGQVLDSNGDPLPGVTVQAGKNSKIATVTNTDGTFALQLNRGHAVEVDFSYIGMIPEKYIFKCKEDFRNLLIKMKDDESSLKEVVVTGIFRKAKESYTGSVATIGSEQLQQYRGQNLLQTLKNADASINFSIDNLNGSNPNKLPNINIRGNSSLPMSVEEFNAGQESNPNTPLVIMDGFEISLTKLMDYNDEEIESINILKDAAATAIYGSRGANGVIVVITKRPEPGKLRVNVEAGIQMEMPDLTSYHMLNAAQKLDLEKKAGLYDKAWSADNKNKQEILRKEAYQKRLRDVLNGVDTDWLSKPLRTGVGQRYNLRVEGGSQEFRWAADAQYNDVEGAMKGSKRRTFNGGITLLYTFKNLAFRNYTSVGINNSQESPYGTFSTYVNQQPYNAPYDANGNLRKTFDGFWAWAGTVENPLYNASLDSFDKSSYQELTNNFSVDWKILPELTLRGQLGISKNDSETNYFLSPEDTYFSNSDTGKEYQTSEGYLRRGIYRYGNGKRLTVNADVTLSYNKIFHEVHSLYAGLNWSMQQSNYDYFRMTLEGFSNEALNNIANARQYKQDEMPSGTNTKTRQFGVTANINYTYNSKYYIDFSYRIDGNSSYGSDKKYAPFWSTGIGWNLHNEKFLKGNGIVNMLRLKASYGETGAASGALETDAYTYYKYVSDNRYMSWMGAQLGGFGNPNLSWQTTKEMNIGTEFGFLDNRIKGSFDVYTKKTNNLLSSMDLPLSMGFSSYRANIGEVKNVGWEASLQGFIIRDAKRKINWMVGAQLVYNKNKITHLSQAIKDQTEAYMTSDAEDNDASGIQNLFYEGRPQNAIYAVRSLGIDPSTGKEIYLDRDGNITDTWKAKDKVYCGSADPKYRGILNTMFQWGDFTLNASFGYYWGGKVYNSTLRDRVEVGLYAIEDQNVDERVLNQRWYQPGDVVFFPKLSNYSTKASSRYVMDNNVLELQTVSLQYKLKNPYLQRTFKLNSLILGVNFNDLIHWGSVKMERGTSYPYARNIQASVKLLF